MSMLPPPPPPGGPAAVPPPPPGWYVSSSWPQPGGQYYQPGPTRRSGMAVAAMVLGILWIFWIGSILAVIFGHVAMNRIKHDRTLGGRGMAIAGVVLGYVGLGILVLSVII